MSAQGTKKRVSAIHGINTTNIIPMTEFIPVALDTLKRITDVLYPICGPSAKYHLVIQPERNIDTGTVSSDPSDTSFYSTNKFQELDIFSKDGAHCIASMEFGNPIQEYIKNTILYVGKSVDEKCGDGTTTAMLMAAEVLKSIFIKHDVCKNIRYTTNTINTIMQEFITMTMRALDDYVITIDKYKQDFNHAESHAPYTESEIMAGFAWMQAYTSSHQDLAISEAFSEAYSHITKADMHHIALVFPEVEQESIEVEVSDSQFEFRSIFHMVASMNSDFRRTYRKNDVKLLNFPYGVSDDGPVTLQLVQYIETLHRADTVVVVSPNLGNGFVETFISKNKARVEDESLDIPEVICISHQAPISRFQYTAWSSLALSGIMNRDCFDDPSTPFADRVKEGVSVYFDGVSITKLDHLVDTEDGVSCMSHPGIKQPEAYEFFTIIKDQLEKRKDFIMAQHVKDSIEIDHVVKAIASMEHLKTVRIIGGGTTIKQLASRLTIQDCAKACTSIMKEGFLTNGIIRFAGVTDPSRHSDTELVHTLLLETFHNASMSICRALADDDLLSTKDIASFNTDAGAYGFLDLSKDSILSGVDRYTGEHIFACLADKTTRETRGETVLVPPIQSTAMFRELFTRISEIIIPLMSTDTIIIPGYMWDMTPSTPSGN